MYWFVVTRITHKGNPWSVERPGTMDRARAKAVLRYTGKIRGRTAYMISSEKSVLTMDDIVAFQDSGVLPR